MEGSGQRIKGISIVKPIVYGNTSRYFGKKREEDGRTHDWSIFVRPYRNEDMSVYVKKVHFKLHDSYPNATRVVTKPPYEISETGWGEFEIMIKIYFVDPNEKPVSYYHMLRLFQSEMDIMLGNKALIREEYDELVFQDPTELMQQLLVGVRPLSLTAYKHETNFEEKKEKQLKAVTAAKSQVRSEINDLTARLNQTKDAIQKFTEEIKKLDHDDVKLESNLV